MYKMPGLGPIFKEILTFLCCGNTVEPLSLGIKIKSLTKTLFFMYME